MKYYFKKLIENLKSVDFYPDFKNHDESVFVEENFGCYYIGFAVHFDKKHNCFGSYDPNEYSMIYTPTEISDLSVFIHNKETSLNDEEIQEVKNLILKNIN